VIEIKWKNILGLGLLVCLPVILLSCSGVPRLSIDDIVYADPMPVLPYDSIQNYVIDKEPGYSSAQAVWEMGAFIFTTTIVTAILHMRLKMFWLRICTWTSDILMNFQSQWSGLS